MDVLVTGASGFVGSGLVPALVGAGHRVRALVRDADGYDAPRGVSVREGDLLEAESVESALADVEAAYYLVHSVADGPEYAERDRRAVHNFALAADAAGLDRAVYLGGLGEARADLSAHLRSRREVEAVLRESAFDLTTLRTAPIVGAGGASFELMRRLVSRLPVVLAPSWVDTRCQPVALGDVVSYLIGVLGVEATRGETYEVGGPEVLTYAEMLRRTGREVRGHATPVVTVPGVSSGLWAYWVSLLTGVPRSVARPLVAGLRTPLVVSDHHIEALLPVERAGFDDAVARALADGGERRRASTSVAGEW